MSQEEKPAGLKKQKWLIPAVTGAVLGGTFSLLLEGLGLLRVLPLSVNLIPIIFMALFGLVGVTKARFLTWGLNAACLLAYILIGYFGVAVPACLNMVLREEPVKADAVIVLSSGVSADNKLSPRAVQRLLKGMELVKSGYSENLVLTRIGQEGGSGEPDQDRILGLMTPAPKLYRIGQVLNTHDEAVQMAELAAKKGWKKILLVTSAMHSRRSKLVFQKAGLDVVAVPSEEREFQIEEGAVLGGAVRGTPPLSSFEDRIYAFHQWIHEEVGIVVYRARGWI